MTEGVSTYYDIETMQWSRLEVQGDLPPLLRALLDAPRLQGRHLWRWRGRDILQ